MQRMLVFSAVSWLFTLCACGVGDPSDTGRPIGPNEPRRSIAGTYEVLGRLTVEIDGSEESRQVKDFLRLEPVGASPGLSLTIESLECGSEGQMTGETAFLIGAGMCSLAEDGPCTFALNVEEGRGGWTSNAPPTVQSLIQAQLVVSCEKGSASAKVLVEVNGPRRRLDAREQASMSAGEPTLHEALDEFAQSMSLKLR